MNSKSQTNARSSDCHVSPRDVEAFHTVIEQLTGLRFDDWRLDTLAKTLDVRMAVQDMRQVPCYLDLLQNPVAGAEELGAVLDAITVNETFFFRYPVQFDFLRRRVFPELVSRRAESGRAIKVCSAGCSTGEEPYSIALTALDLFGPAAADLLRITATDASSAALDMARHAEYSAKSLRLVDEATRCKYFRPIGDNRFVLSDAVRRTVQFRQSNLLDDIRSRAMAWDVVFCRNVLIYFNPEAAAKVLNALYHSLNEGGYLFVGHSEILKPTVFTPCQPEGVFAYQKTIDDSTTARLTAGSHHAANAEILPPVPVVAQSAASTAVQTLYDEAFASFRREEFAQAQEQLDRLLAANPRHLPATLLRANVYLSLGDYNQSVQECDVALELDPLTWEAHLLLGMNFLRLAKPQIAVHHLKKAAYLAPNSAIVQFQLGEAYRSQDLWIQAVRAYRNARSLFPATADRDIHTYCGGFGKSTLESLCEQMLAHRF